MMTGSTAPRRCSVCHAVYPGTERFCSIDGGAITEDVPRATDPWIGRTIDGRYLVRSILGRGGMGVVYAAEHVGLDRQVALKVLLDDAADPDARARFRREARLASKIVHEHVVQIFDVGTADESDFLVMEYVEGPDLHRVLGDEGPLEPDRAVRIARQILAGLQAIHDEGIVHRDLKPSNVLLATDGQVKITDFGISKAFGEGMTSNLTGAANVIGTPEYMAPEQLAGTAIDHRADIYAAGVTLYAMLAGKLPFTNRLITERAPTLDAVRPGLPTELGAAVARALAKEPADRFADARAFAYALDQIGAIGQVAPPADELCDPPTVAAKPASRQSEREAAVAREGVHAPVRSRRATAALVGAAVVISTLMIAGALAWRQRGRTPTTSATRAATPGDAQGADANDVAMDLAFARKSEHEGKLELAVAAYEDADRLEPTAELAFRIGELYERLGNKPAAAASFTRYLDRAKDASDRDAVRARIAELATIDAGVARDGGAQISVGTTWPARIPTPIASGSAMVGDYCNCVTRWPSRGPDEQPLCKQAVPRCRCVFDRRLEMCPVPVVKCVDGEPGCSSDHVKCTVPIDVLGHTADEACRGYESIDDVAPKAGAYECNYCSTSKRYSYRGHNGEACTGLDHIAGKSWTGKLEECGPKEP